MFVFLLVASAISIFVIYLWLISTAVGNVRTKLMGMPVSFFHLLLSRDNVWKKSGRDAQDVISVAMRRPELVQKKRIYFVRHGESMWNEVFNRGRDLSMVWRFIAFVIQEVNILTHPDSVFWDSPLSPVGIRQSVQLSGWLEHMRSRNAHAAFLCGDTAVASVVCVSNLRRAVSTILTGLSGRLSRAAKEKVHIVSSAQEITRNIDGYSLSDAGSVPGPSWVELEQPELDHVVNTLYKKERLDGTYNKGNKSLFSSNGKVRMEEFCNLVFNSDLCKDTYSVILGGHSLWFREFFKMYLPGTCSHEGKSKKIVNCGIIAFELISCGDNQFAIDPDSIETVYGGFEEKKSKFKV